MSAVLRPFPGVGIAESIPNTMDFQEVNSKGKFSAQPLRNKTIQNPNLHHRPSASLITAGMPLSKKVVWQNEG